MVKLSMWSVSIIFILNTYYSPEPEPIPQSTLSTSQMPNRTAPKPRPLNHAPKPHPPFNLTTPPNHAPQQAYLQLQLPRFRHHQRLRSHSLRRAQ